MLVNFKVALAVSGERQVGLAQRCGIDPTLLSLVINERREASAELRSKLAEALSVSEQWLFTRRKRGAEVGSFQAHSDAPHLDHSHAVTDAVLARAVAPIERPSTTRGRCSSRMRTA